MSRRALLMMLAALGVPVAWLQRSEDIFWVEKDNSFGIKEGDIITVAGVYEKRLVTGVYDKSLKTLREFTARYPDS